MSRPDPRRFRDGSSRRRVVRGVTRGAGADYWLLEKEATRGRDTLNADRRRLPLGQDSHATRIQASPMASAARKFAGQRIAVIRMSSSL